jgi:pyruvate dehydrogenase E2 component (dihydrolipoamide acetyltransferase)
MPDLGTNVEVVTLLSWLKNVGDAVTRGEPLCEIETDKATTQLESVADGVVLRHVVGSGTEVEVGQLIAYIGAPGEAIPQADREAPAAPAPSRRTQETPRQVPKADASPLLRNLAERMGVDLNTVTGTGPGGRITRDDILRAAKMA